MCKGKLIYRSKPSSFKKSYHQYLFFISSVKSGKKTIVIGKDNVVISRKRYDELVKDDKDRK